MTTTRFANNNRCSGFFRAPLLALGTLLLCALLDPAGAAGKDTRPLQFALVGDGPYTAGQRADFLNMVKEINKEDLGFVLHAGDFQFDGIAWKETSKGLPPCSDETFKDRLSLTGKIKHPFIFTPGDNDWTDCHRAKPQAYDPLERLAKVREVFFKGDKSLGARTLKLTRQSKDPRYSKYRENARWVWGDVLFVTLHMVGSNNNLGRTPEMDKEYEERNAANLAWLNEAFDIASRAGNKAVMIVSQANPQFENGWTAKVKKRYLLGGLGIKPPKERRETGFDDFLAALEKHVVKFGKPVAYVHGDTHTFRMDKPLLGTDSHRIVKNFTRVETFGFPDTHWVRITIDPTDPNVFQFSPQIVGK